jgi:hypothetical protein
MSNTLDKSVLDAVKKGFAHNYFKDNSKKIENVFISFSSPWFMPKTKHVDIIKDKSFAVTESFVSDLIKKEEEQFKEEIKNEHDGNLNDTFEVVEKSIVHIKVNGYVLKNIIGHRTNSLDAYLCMSIISGGVLEKVMTIVMKHTHISREDILVHTFPLISFTVLRDIVSSNQDFIILDATSEVTDITLVKGDVIVNTASIPTGKNFIIRQVAKKFNVTVEIAESTLSLFAAEKLDTDTVSKMEEIMTEVEKEWAIYLEKALIDLSPEMSLPNKLYITSDAESAKIYTHFIKLPKADITASFRKNVEVVHVDDKMLSGHYKNDSLSQPNEFVIILSVFYQKLAF